MNRTYKYDSEIVDVVVRIMGNGTFRAETINESILFKLLELRGTPITLDKSGYNRDVEADWIRENPFNILSEANSLPLTDKE